MGPDVPERRGDPSGAQSSTQEPWVFELCDLGEIKKTLDPSTSTSCDQALFSHANAHRESEEILRDSKSRTQICCGPEVVEEIG